MSLRLVKILLLTACSVVGAAGFYAWTQHDPPTVSVTAPAQTRLTRAISQRQVVPARLKFLSNTDEPWQVRIDLLRNTMAEGCSENELRHLYDLLKTGYPAGEVREHWHMIANDIMIHLAAKENNPERFSANLLGLLHDPQQSEVLRDYAVQYLSNWINPRFAQNGVGGLAAPQAEMAADVLRSLVMATMDPHLEQTTIPGTTLMMLVELSRSASEVDCTESIETLKPWLTRALQTGSEIANPVRVSAVQAAGVLAPEEFRPLLRQIAFQENGTGSLRLPSIAALGQCGEAVDLDQLRRISETSPELSYAAQTASVKLAARLASPESK